MTQSISVYTPASPGNICYWSSGAKNGAIRVTLYRSDISDPAVIELAALHYLLVDQGAMGTDRSGKNLHINTSCGAIKKIQKGRSSKKYLIEFSGFLRTRFVDAVIKTTKNSSIIEDAEPVEVYVSEPLVDTFQSPYVGPVKLTYHALEAFYERGGYSKLDNAWRAMKKNLESLYIKQVSLPEKVRRHKEKKYGDTRAAETWFCPQTGWYFTIVQHPGDLQKTLVTSYLRDE